MRRISGVLSIVLTCLSLMQAQQLPSSPGGAALPRLLRFSGTARDVNGKPLTGIVGITFSLYSEQAGGSPLWLETQNVQPDSSGRYSVLLGSTKAEGLPVDLFTSEQAHWVGVQISGQAEEARALLVSAPYALKAGDAETVGGLPASAFMLAIPGSANKPNDGSGTGPGSDVLAAAVVSGSGTADFIPLWTNTSIVGNSVLFQSGSGSSATVGINTTTPAATLDVNGGVIARGLLQLPSTGTANAGSGFSSQPFSLQGSSFNSSTGKAVGPLFQWQTEPIGNNSSNPAGTLNLLYGNGSGSPAETGLNIASNGQITFVAGQTFPGTGNGTITGVTAGTDLTGGGSSGNVTLNVDTTQVMTGVLAGSDLTGGGTGGVQTLNLDTTKVPQLGANDSFTGAVGIGAPANPNGWTPLALGSANSFGTWMTLANTSTGGHTWNILSAASGNSEGAGNLGITDFTGTSTIYLEGNTNTASLTATGAVNGAVVNATSSFNLGGTTFASGSPTSGNVFLGFSGNSTTTGSSNTANGVSALLHDTTGSNNSANGLLALLSNTAGSSNTANGATALVDNTTGNANTADGATALFNNSTGLDNTANGFSALVDNTTGSENTAVGALALYYNAAGSSNTALGFQAGPDSNSSNLTNATALGAFAQVTESNALVLGSIKGVNSANADTNVGIGTTAPGSPLTVVGNSTFAPVLVTTANSFGTWLEIGNTSIGGHTWNIISAGGGNAEKAGNIGITDLTGKSTIWLEGNVNVSGNLSKGGGSFKIDHPLDPANKYLYHSFVESPDMMDVYNGNVKTNGRGLAVVVLPDYFQALNRDFRYQLTVIGQFAQAIVSQEISGNRFTIKTSRPAVKVSWQVTGIRQDAYANAYRIPVEEDKPAQEQGRYLHPELFGAAHEQAIGMNPGLSREEAPQVSQ